jgi:glycosyltransferase involved in cell wall biosynthesis
VSNYPRVLIDATAVTADRGGLGRYVDGLIPALAQLDADLAIACQRSDADRYAAFAPAARIAPAPAAISHRAARIAWEQTGLPLLSQHLGAQVLHAPHYTMPLRSSCPVVVTVHDATLLTEPNHYDKARRAFMRSAIKTALRRATRVIVPSKATRDELIRLRDADPARLDVSYHGVNGEAFHPPSVAEVARVKARLGLGSTEYVAFLGVQEPRKNVPNLIRGWVTACEGRPDPPALIIAGGSGHDDEIDAAIGQVPSHLRLLRPGYLRYADLPGYLGGAVVVAYPSHGEGFGLPVLEAMACGAAVLVTPRLSLPEVGGNAVAYTAEDAETIARDLTELLADPDRRKKLGDAASQRAIRFTWQASAQAHLESYTRAAQRH